MIKFEHTEVMGWKAAIRGMRNPLESWSKSDSHPAPSLYEVADPLEKHPGPWDIGPNDLDLMKRLRDAGTDHRKFLRMIVVYVDITAPLYWWKEFDTYKVGTVANSCSTMHCIQKKEITLADFSLEHVKLCDAGKAYFAELEKLRKKYVETKDKKYWYALIQLLPSSYNQKRTVMLNYEVLANIYHSRLHHKLDEWNGEKSGSFCQWIESLPYSELITGGADSE